MCANEMCAGGCRLVDDKENEVQLPPSIKEVFLFSLVSEHYPALAFQASQSLKFQTTDVIRPPFVMDVFLLDTLTEMLTTPLRLLSYVKLRVLEIAYTSVHHSGVVGLDELLKAYKSGDYASYREDLAALQLLTTEVRRKRTDLWNPFKPVDESGKRERQNLEQRQSQVATASMLAAMTKEERTEHARSNRQQPAKSDGTMSRRSKKPPLTADELTRNSMLFRDNLKGS